MHHFIFSSKDAWISSGSSHIDQTSFKDQNFGQLHNFYHVVLKQRF